MKKTFSAKEMQAISDYASARNLIPQLSNAVEGVIYFRDKATQVETKLGLQHIINTVRRDAQ